MTIQSDGVRHLLFPGLEDGDEYRGHKNQALKPAEEEVHSFIVAESGSAALIETDIKPFVDLSFVFRAEDRESAHFGRSAHMRSPARLRIKPLDLHDADLAV